MQIKDGPNQAQQSGLAQEDFATYRVNIKRLVEEIEKIRVMQERRQQMLASLNFTASLEACRQHVPPKYFTHNFPFDSIVKNFSRKNAISMQLEVPMPSYPFLKFFSL
jgi:hypothetical protein